MSISQKEFDYLLDLQKHFKEDDIIELGHNWSRDIIAVDTKDAFILYFYKGGTISLKKFTYNKTYKKTIVLLRFDSYGRHTNPDGHIFEGPHVHIYREGFDDKFAFSISEIGIEDNKIEMDSVLQRFLDFCNVVNYPKIQLTLL